MWVLTNQAGLSDSEIRALDAELSSRRLLEEVVRWAFAQSPPLELVDVVSHDEFTQDVVFRRPDRRALVFDCT